MSDQGRSEADSRLQFRSDKIWTAVSIFTASRSAARPKSPDYKSDSVEWIWIKLGSLNSHHTEDGQGFR